jgi:hypothetical protein
MSVWVVYQNARATVVDWERIIDDLLWLMGDPDPRNPELLRKAISPRQLATRIGVPYTTVDGWMNGNMPRANDLAALAQVWVSLTSKAPEFVPLKRIELSASAVRYGRRKTD